MKYEYAPDIQEIAVEVSKLLYPHIKLDRIKCFRSYGTSSRGTIARCHGLGKLMQVSLGVEAFYPLEFIHERFDKLTKEEQVKVIIHELMHIPKTFGGGFRQHDFVCDKNVNNHYKLYINMKEKENSKGFFGFFSRKNGEIKRSGDPEPIIDIKDKKDPGDKWWE